MGVEIAPAQNSSRFARGLLGPARQHDPGALKRIARGALVQHQRHPAVGEDILRMQRQP